MGQHEVALRDGDERVAQAVVYQNFAPPASLIGV